MLTCHDGVIKWEHLPVTGEFPAQRLVTRSFDVFFDMHLNKRFSKQSWDWWCETPSRPLWRHCDVIPKMHSCEVRSLSCCDIANILAGGNVFTLENFTSPLGFLAYCNIRHSWICDNTRHQEYISLSKSYIHSPVSLCKLPKHLLSLYEHQMFTTRKCSSSNNLSVIPGENIIKTNGATLTSHFTTN